jgi:hypothetical protein
MADVGTFLKPFISSSMSSLTAEAQPYVDAIVTQIITRSKEEIIPAVRKEAVMYGVGSAVLMLTVGYVLIREFRKVR